MPLTHMSHTWLGVQSWPTHGECWRMDLNRAVRPPTTARCVRVWFGTRVIASTVTKPADATAYEAAMRRRFAGRRVTNGAVTSL